MHICLNIYTHNPLQTRTTNTHTHTYKHSLTHSYTHAHIQTLTHSYTHTHTHTQAVYLYITLSNDRTTNEAPQNNTLLHKKTSVLVLDIIFKEHSQWNFPRNFTNTIQAYIVLRTYKALQ